LKIGESTPEPVRPFKFAPTRLKVPGRTIIKKLSLQVDTEIMEGKVTGLSDYVRNKDNTEEVVDMDKIDGPLWIRSRRSGDEFHPLGAGGRTKLKKFFIDNKIPKSVRDRIPLVTDNKRIVWVLGYRLADELKITDQTRRVLKVKFTKLEQPHEA
jgi:tRNA(Ile)-lysidine synthase